MDYFGLVVINSYISLIGQVVHSLIAVGVGEEIAAEANLTCAEMEP